jgi:Zn-dependent peptidase ImmA (M78 family)
VAVALPDQPYFPVIDVIEKVLDRLVEGFDFLVGSEEEMEGAEGFTAPDGSFIMLHERVYVRACRGDGRARFTAAHELGHWALHTGVPLARPANPKSVKPYYLSEPQANQYAADLLMPARFIRPSDEPEDLMERFGVSYEAAENRLSYLLKKGFVR